MGLCDVIGSRLCETHPAEWLPLELSARHSCLQSANQLAVDPNRLRQPGGAGTSQHVAASRYYREWSAADREPAHSRLSRPADAGASRHVAASRRCREPVAADREPAHSRLHSGLGVDLHIGRATSGTLILWSIP
jgi:hypothetical protein